jgi:hypothetical protein
LRKLPAVGINNVENGKARAGQREWHTYFLSAGWRFRNRAGSVFPKQRWRSPFGPALDDTFDAI